MFSLLVWPSAASSTLQILADLLCSRRKRECRVGCSGQWPQSGAGECRCYWWGSFLPNIVLHILCSEWWRCIFLAFRVLWKLSAMFGSSDSLSPSLKWKIVYCRNENSKRSLIHFMPPIFYRASDTPSRGRKSNDNRKSKGSKALCHGCSSGQNWRCRMISFGGSKTGVTFSTSVYKSEGWKWPRLADSRNALGGRQPCKIGGGRA